MMKNNIILVFIGSLLISLGVFFNFLEKYGFNMEILITMLKVYPVALFFSFVAVLLGKITK